MYFTDIYLMLREKRKDVKLKKALEEALETFCKKLNKRKYQEFKYCQLKLSGLLKNFPCIQKFVQCSLTKADTGAISLTWSWDEASIAKEVKYDGIFALLTNYTKEQENPN